MKYCKDCPEKSLRIQQKDSVILNLSREIDKLKKDNHKLILRLDACLYAMVTFQSLICEVIEKPESVKVAF